MSEAVEPIILVDANDPDKKPLLYACGKCGSVHSPEIYLARKEVRHATALEAARDCYNCKTHSNCRHCGVECGKGWTACDKCRLEREIERATEVPNDGGPYFGFGDQQMYHEMDDARDAGHEWVCPTNKQYPRIEAWRVFENLTEDMFEDASEDDLNGTAELTAAIEAFNEAQTTCTYWADLTRKIKVPPCDGEAA
ncbi:hypothetical protein [Novosphingobium pentaromativorans]|uniref:Uncharacterized protein n=1 Tax=Novosphingobium pentaromativorans US6-1 TaxID=1088721 RepID=G6E7E4_9SPHN|nr:hypothetical protein [Novosphingobium pentaromativorans]AIT81649.1 hypothetical protein JI59_18725 [Novosphingobium pentaromativorans US6-1]EHJ62767.1 hypothetical protein NSU_0279 [Novosphingobium pentaromativorans US6-1]